MSAKNEYVDEKYETESYQSTGDNAVNRSSVLSMKTLRNSYIIFPFVVVVCIIIYASMEKSSQTSTDVNIASATASSDKLEGTYFLFDLSTEQGALENDNVYESPDYADAVATMTANVNTWLTRVGDADIPTTEGERDTWATNGGVSPWIPDTALARDVPQKYSYAAAPHIVFLLVDDWGYNDVGYQSNYLSWATPNIDKIASNGIKLTNYYTNNLCTPSRASLMTGRYALRFGMHGTPDDAELPISEATLAEELKSAGYRTNLVGKWHLGWSSEEKTPNKRGFDYFYGYLGGHIDYWTKLFMGTNLDLNDNGRIVTTEWELDQSLHSAYLFQSKVESVIEDHATNHAQDPMFLYYASQLVHSDWAAPQKYIDRCSAADLTAVEIPDLTYCGMNLMLDEVVGNLTCALDKYGMADNTVLIIASDNGGYAAMAGTNYPYRGSKGSLTRGGESVAALIHAPMSLMPDAAKGSSYDGQMHVTDWLPTLMGLATGGAWTGSLVDNTIDGWDMWNAVTTNTPSPRREIVNYLTSDGEVSYILDGKKLIVSESSLDAVTPPSFEFQGTQLAADVCIV